jgi:WD40 repeat protein
MHPHIQRLGLTALALALLCSPSDLAASPPEVTQSNLVKLYYEITMTSFSPDGTMLAVGGDAGNPPQFMVCQTSNLAPVWSRLAGFGEGRPTSASFAPQNAAIALAGSSGAAGALTVVPPYALGDLSRGGLANAVAFSPAPSSYPTLIMAGVFGIAPATLNFIAYPYGVWGGGIFPGSFQGSPVNCLVFEPDGATFWLGNGGGTVQHWQVSPPQLLWQTNFANNSVSGINLLPDGRRLVTLCSNTTYVQYLGTLQDVRVWETASGEWLQLVRPGLPVLSTTLTADGSYLFTVLATTHNIGPPNPDYYTNNMVLWRVSDGRLMVRYDEDLPEVQQVAIAPDGKTFAYGRGDGIVALARMPLLVDELVRAGNQTALSWQGGSGRYQVQQSASVTAGSWQNVGGPTTNTTFRVTLADPTVFYRVLSLTNSL